MRLGLGLGLNKQGTAGGGAASPYLDGVLDSVCAELDATIEASYPGTGQTWASLTAAPADGSSQTDWDAWLGLDGTADSADPGFVGTAGDPAAYFNIDLEGDYFKFKTPSAMTAAQNGIRKVSGNAFWIATIIKTQPSGSLGTDCWFGGANTSTLRGITVYHSGTGRLNFWTGHSSFSDFYQTGTGVITTNTTYLCVMSCNPLATTSNLRIWLNSADVDYTANVNMVTDTVATTNYWLGAAANSSNAPSLAINTDAQIKYFAFGNEFLDDTKAAALIAHLEARHGVDYTP